MPPAHPVPLVLSESLCTAPLASLLSIAEHFFWPLTRCCAVQAISRMYVNKAQLISMSSQLTEQLGVAKVAGTLSKSTEVMKIVNDLMRTPQLMQTMQQMSREMMKVHS